MAAVDTAPTPDPGVWRRRVWSLLLPTLVVGFWTWVGILLIWYLPTIVRFFLIRWTRAPEEAMVDAAIGNQEDVVDAAIGNQEGVVDVAIENQEGMADAVTFSWRGKGVLPDVENRGLNPTCWIYALVTYLEARFRIETRRILKFSKQRLLDGCFPEKTEPYGFSVKMALEWIKQHGITTESAYQWTGLKSILRIVEPLYVVDEIEQAPDLFDDDYIKKMLRRRPICATIKAAGFSPNLPKDSIYRVGKRGYDAYVNRCVNLNRPVVLQAVLLTGWNVINGIHVWEAQSSYGVDFCDGGFFYFVRGSAIDEEVEYNPLCEILDAKIFKRLEK